MSSALDYEENATYYVDNNNSDSLNRVDVYMYLLWRVNINVDKEDNRSCYRHVNNVDGEGLELLLKEGGWLMAIYVSSHGKHLLSRECLKQNCSLFKHVSHISVTTEKENNQA